MREKIRVLIKEPNSNARIDWIEPTLENFQAIVDGHIECVHYEDDIYFYIDEEGKLKNKKLNFLWHYGDVIVGTAVFFRRGIGGVESSLSWEELFDIDFDVTLRDLLFVPFHELKRW